MKLFVSLSLILSLVSQAMAPGAMADEHMTCAQQMEYKLDRLADMNRRSSNDLGLGLGFVVPVVVVFGVPLMALFVVPGIYYKIKENSRYINAKRVMKMYDEAAAGGGKFTRKIYKKILKANPALDLSYERMLSQINEMNLKGEACALEYPNKKEMIDAIVIQ